jgi:hypothetical protein
MTHEFEGSSGDVVADLGLNGADDLAYKVGLIVSFISLPIVSQIGHPKSWRTRC